jgi:sister-chromatid-cohesion protein PDS5
MILSEKTVQMENQLEQQVIATMKRLQPLPQSKDSLLEILEKVASALSKVHHEPSEEMWEETHPSRIALVMSELLRHKDGDVSLMVATCISEITRISTPDAPYEDDVMRDAFQLIISTF